MRYRKKESHGPLFSLQFSQEEGLILIYNEYKKSKDWGCFRLK